MSIRPLSFNNRNTNQPLSAWSGITYQKPFNPISPRSQVFFNVRADNADAGDQWGFYKQPGDKYTELRQPSFAVLTACQQAKLFRVVHDSINIYCGARGKVTAKAVVGCYKRYCDWEENLPGQIRNVGQKGRHLPHITFL